MKLPYGRAPAVGARAGRARESAVVLRVVVLVVGQELTDDVHLAADRLGQLGEVPAGLVLCPPVRRHLDDHRLMALVGREPRLLCPARSSGIGTDADVEVDVLASLQQAVGAL